MPETFIDSRAELAKVVKVIRIKFPRIAVGDAWVSKPDDNNIYRFVLKTRTERFIWEGPADNAWQARAKGWQSYIDKREKDV